MVMLFDTSKFVNMIRKMVRISRRKNFNRFFHGRGTVQSMLRCYTTALPWSVRFTVEFSVILRYLNIGVKAEVQPPILRRLACARLELANFLLSTGSENRINGVNLNSHWPRNFEIGKTAKGITCSCLNRKEN